MHYLIPLPNSDQQVPACDISGYDDADLVRLELGERCQSQFLSHHGVKNDARQTHLVQNHT